MASAVADEEPVRRRDEVSLAGLWASLRREVEDRPEVRADLAAVALEIVDLYSNLRLD